jgi:branched-chain amino acid transport system substrate-binding protein
MLLKLQEEKVDVIMFEVFSPELEIIAKQYKELGMTIPITGIEAIEFTDQPELFEGVWYVQAADATSEFRDLYKETYNKDFKIGGPNAYDCVNLLVKAFESAGDGTSKPSIESVVEAFGNIKNFNGAVGPLTVDAKHFVQSEAVVRQVVDGKFITLGAVESTKLSGKTIKIGLSAPLTGEAASFGQNQLAGAELAVKELNDNGGILGRPVELIVEDDQCGPKGVSVYTKFTTIDNVVGIVGSVCSAAAGPSLPISADSNTPTIIFASAPQLLSAGDNVFRVYPSDALQGAAGADIMYNKLGVKKVALLYVENDWGKGLQRVFKEKYEALGGEIVYITGVLPTEKDYKTTLMKVQASGAEGVYLPLYPNQMVPTLKQMKELGIEVPIVSGDVFAADEVIKSGYANGAIYVQGKTDISDEFKGRIHSLPEFKNLDINLMTVYGYDGVMVMAKAIENAGTNKDDVIAALHETHYRGQSQSLIEFGPDRELKNAVFQYMTIVNNTAVEYK